MSWSCTAAEGGTISPEQRASLDTFLKRGGGIVMIHDAVCGTDPHWFKTIIGGAWEHRHSKWYEGEVGVYFLDTEHPITQRDFELRFEGRDLLRPAHDAGGANSGDVVSFACSSSRRRCGSMRRRELSRRLSASRGMNMNRSICRIFARFCCAASRGRASARMWMSFARRRNLASLKYPKGGPTAPEKAAAKFDVHPEFDINLVASEPLIEKVDFAGLGPARGVSGWRRRRNIRAAARSIKNDAMVALWIREGPGGSARRATRKSPGAGSDLVAGGHEWRRA